MTQQCRWIFEPVQNLAADGCPNDSCSDDGEPARRRKKIAGLAPLSTIKPKTNSVGKRFKNPVSGEPERARSQV